MIVMNRLDGSIATVFAITLTLTVTAAAAAADVGPSEWST